jgi:hypothetical protein
VGVKGGMSERRVRHRPRRRTTDGHVVDAVCARAERAWAQSGRGVREREGGEAERARRLRPVGRMGGAGPFSKKIDFSFLFLKNSP